MSSAVADGFLFCGKKNLPIFDSLGFSCRTLFCLASEAFMIFSSVIADGFSSFDFWFFPILVILSTAFEF